MNIKVSTAPEFYPITLTELKQQLRLSVVDTDQDDELTAYLQAATEAAQDVAAQYFMKQTLEIYFDDWSLNFLLYGITPIQSISAISYLDANGDWQTWASSNYSLDLISSVPRVKFLSSFPTLQDETLNRIKLTCEVGYSNSADEAVQQAAVPQNIKQAIKLVATRYYLTREDKAMNPAYEKSSDSILRSIRATLWSWKWVKWIEKYTSKRR